MDRDSALFAAGICLIVVGTFSVAYAVARLLQYGDTAGAFAAAIGGLLYGLGIAIPLIER